jgi:hypothetical protein
MDKENLWHEIFSTTDESETLVLRGLLESEGVRCRIVSHKVPQFPVNVNGLGLIKLEVLKDDVEKAIEILSGKINQE